MVNKWATAAATCAVLLALPASAQLPFRTCPAPTPNNRFGKNITVENSYRCADDESASCKPYATLRGTVTDEAGAPAEDIPIVIERISQGHVYKTTTGKSGKYNYEGLPAGDYAVCASFKGDLGLSRPITLTTGNVALADFDLKFFEGRK